MTNKRVIKMTRNSKGLWRFIVVIYPSKLVYYVNNFKANGELISYRFNYFHEANQFFNSQTCKKNRRNNNNDQFELI